MSAKKLLDLLVKNGLLEDSVMADLRKQVADTKGKITAEALAKALVDKGHLTKFQATRLVGEATKRDEGKSEPKADSKSDAKSGSKSESKPARKSDDDLLDLAPLDDDEPEEKKPAPAASSSKPAKRPAAEEVVMLEDADALTPVEDAGAGLTPIGSGTGAGPTDFRSQVDQMVSGGRVGGPVSGLNPLSGTGGFEPFDGGLEPLSADPFGAQAAPAAPSLQSTKKKREIRWDTKLMLGGFGTLGLLIFLGVLLVMWIMSEPTIKIWEASEEAYNSGNFPDAKEKYELYLGRVGSKGENASKARVRILLCQLRNDVSDPERGLKSATEVLPQIDLEEDANVAREEYPGFLPQIAEGFIKRAHQAKDVKSTEELVNKAQQARDLLHQPGVLPTKQRNLIQPQLTAIDEAIVLLKRAIAQDQELTETIADMLAACDAGQTEKAYQLYNELLKKYPVVWNDASLLEAVAKVTERERTMVRVKQEELAPVNMDETRKSEFRVVLAARSGGDSALQGQVATLLYSHSVYALDAGNGRVLWSRYVGTAARANPVRVTTQPDADVLVVDAQRHELLRVKALDGSLVWKLAIGESFTEPFVAGNRVYVSTESGRILEIDAEAGGSKRHLLIPQRLSVSPVVDPVRPRMYQVGEHSNLYVIHTDSMQCEDVIYLGHKGGAVTIPPLILMGHVFVAETPASDYSLVHSLKIRTQGEGPKLFKTQDPLRTLGRVVVPLTAFGTRRLLVLTDRGEIRVFDVDGTKNEDTLSDTGRVPAPLTTPHVGYPLADGNTTLWLADNKLTKYTVRPTTKELITDPAITCVGDSFVAPLQLFGSYLIHVRRAAGSTGATVACIHTEQPRKFVWQTQLGVPAGRIAVDAARREIVAVSSAASLFQINGEVLKQGYADQPAQSVARGSGLSFTEPVDFDNGVVALFNPADNSQLLVYDPSVPDSRLKVLALGLQDGRAPCLPIAYRGGLLVPSDKGDVWLFKISDGTQQVLPFRPSLEAGEKVNWLQPATVGPSGGEFVIADSNRNIYRVGVTDQPQPNLSQVLASKLDVEVSVGLASVGDTVYGAARTRDKGDLLVTISAADLKVAKQIELGGRVTWGPTRVGDLIMVVTDASKLRVFDASQQERWGKPAVMHGNPAGIPLVSGDHFIFAGVGGSVWSIAAVTGEEAGRLDIGEPLGAGPVAYQQRLLLCGNDGTLHVIPSPTAEAPATSSASGQ